MFSDHDNQNSAAAAAATSESESTSEKISPQSSAPSQDSQLENKQSADPVDHAGQSSSAAVPQADGDSGQKSNSAQDTRQQDSGARNSASDAEKSHGHDGSEAKTNDGSVTSSEAVSSHTTAGVQQLPAHDNEVATAADEAAGSEEMSKLMEQYDEKQEAAAHSEIIEVTVVAYTEHGVVVDIGQKSEGLIPAAEFS
jgi:hypothetical protein